MTDEAAPYLEVPAEEVPPVIDTAAGLAELLDQLRQANGPIAFDAERAHGHRYWPKAYLFQLRRAGLGTRLIDPIAFEVDGETDLSGLAAATGNAEWIVHAASQDLACMVEDAISPPRLFDTELAARLLNYQYVGLAALVERHFGVRLRKAHSADNWATRPLPDSWLAYAALDVEHLLELRSILAAELEAAGKAGWAEQEFAYLLEVSRRPTVPKTQRWRRLSGLRDVKSRRGLAAARALWLERDRIAAESDRPPGRLVPDSGIVAVAQLVADSGELPGAGALRGLREFSYRGARRYTQNWLNAIQSVRALPRAEWPQKRPPHDGSVGHPKNWARKDPEAAARWEATKPAIDKLADSLDLAPSLLIQPAALREVVFRPSSDLVTQLRGLDARAWQIELVMPTLAQTLGSPDDAATP